MDVAVERSVAEWVKDPVGDLLPQQGST